MPNNDLILSPIGVIHTPYKEKFSVPRQPELVQDGTGIIELLSPYNQPEAVRGLSQFSHLWLIFQFNQVPAKKWHPTVRPPRLGGNQRIGVFASRSTHRPNPLGLSKVRLLHIEYKKGGVFLHLGSVDLVDKTPILDIKPYLAYADAQIDAISGFAQEIPSANLQVLFSAQAQQDLNKFQVKRPHLARFIQELIAQDPRPAYQQQQVTERIYGFSIWEVNVRWKIITQGVAEVLEITPLIK